MAFLDKLRQAQRQAEATRRDPWHPRLKRALEGVEAMSTAALLDLLRADPTTSNARRLATIMRELKAAPIKYGLGLIRVADRVIDHEDHPTLAQLVETKNPEHTGDGLWQISMSI